MNSERKIKIVGVGPAVHHMKVEVPEYVKPAGANGHCRIEDSVGGDVYEILRQASNLGAEVKGLFLVANDGDRAAVEALIRRGLPASITVPCLTCTERTVIKDGHADTADAETTGELPAKELATVADSELTVVGPMTAADQPFVRQIVDTAPRAILQLSAEQVRDAAGAVELAASAWLTVVSLADLETWTGLMDPIAAIQRLREQGVPGILVTSPRGVLGYMDGNWISAPAFQPVAVRRTVGTEDVLVGTLAAAVAAGEPWKHAVHLGLAAAVLYVEGSENCGDRQALETVLRSRLPVPPAPRHADFMAAIRRHAGSIAAGSVLFAIEIGLMLWA